MPNVRLAAVAAHVAAIAAAFKLAEEQSVPVNLPNAVRELAGAVDELRAVAEEQQSALIAAGIVTEAPPADPQGGTETGNTAQG